MNTILLIFMGLFALAAGFGLGSGNYHGFLGAIIPGICAGILAAIPAIRERQWTVAGIMVGCAVVGSIFCAFTSDDNGIKKFCRNQSNLVIRCGSYKLGVNAPPADHQSE